MAAPTVTRPAATLPADEKAAGLPGAAAEWVPYAKWAVLVSVVVGALSLVVIIAVSVAEGSKSKAARAQWDIVYQAEKEKVKPEDRISALEGVAGKVSGTPAHAYVLSQLGSLYYELAQQEEKTADQKKELLKKSADLYQIVATQEPYKSNPAYGPLAAQSLALIHEQAQNFDEAVKVLSAALEQPGISSHFAYEMMQEQLGRVYWLRSLQKEGAAGDADRKLAREKLEEATKLHRSEDRTKQDPLRYSQFVREANAILSLIAEPGKALPDGKAPPAKVAPAPVSGSATIPTPTITPAPAPRSTPAVPEKKTEEKKDAKPNLSDAGGADGAAAAPSNGRHMSYAQMTAMLKSGKNSFCECIRCFDGTSAIGAKLVE